MQNEKKAAVKKRKRKKRKKIKKLLTKQTKRGKVFYENKAEQYSVLTGSQRVQPGQYFDYQLDLRADSM